MTDVKEFLKTVVNSLQYNSGSMYFEHGDKGWENLFADETNFNHGAVFLTEPIQNDFITHRSGLIQERFQLTLVWMLKSEQEWFPKQHNDECIVPIRSLVKKFIYKLMSSREIKEVSNVRALEFINLFDVNTSGLYLTISILPYTTESNCS